MPRSSLHTLLGMTLVLPSAALAFGLGDIHVKSALHEPLAAEIDLVGATDDDLAALTAGIADADTFQRYGLERPAALSTTTFTVSKDGGDPVISLHSTDAFSEPLITLLVHVHSPSGEFIREYAILLDPPIPQPPDNLESKSAAPAASPAATLEETARVAEPERVAAVSADESLRRTYTVAPRDTLERIARLAGARSAAERRRMMIAIFRANQDAFQNNLNRLRSGVTLRLPSQAELSAVSADEADREYASQMRTGGASDHRGAAPITVAAQPMADAEPVSESREADRTELAQRVRSVEESLEQLRQDFARTLAKEPSTRPAPAPIIKPATVITTKQTQIDNTVRGFSRGMALATLAGGLVLALVTAAWFQRRRQRGSDRALSHSASTASSNATGASDTAPSVELPVHPAASNPLDGDQLEVFKPEDETTTAHLVLTGEVKEPRRFVERRKSPADVLRRAVEREPDRSDLRLKLIELYYTAAAQNRRAFVKATRQLAEHQHLVSEEEWSRILKMGHAIAPEDELFAVPRDSKAVA